MSLVISTPTVVSGQIIQTTWGNDVNADLTAVAGYINGTATAAMNTTGTAGGLTGTPNITVGTVSASGLIDNTTSPAGASGGAQFGGNWPGSFHWGFGTDSNSADSTVKLGIHNAGAWQAGAVNLLLTGGLTATTGTFSSQGASTSVSVTQTTNPGNAYVSIQAAGANQYSYTQLGGGQYTWVNTNASNQINWGTTLGTAKAYMDCAAGALTLSAGLTATTGTFSVPGGSPSVALTDGATTWTYYYNHANGYASLSKQGTADVFNLTNAGRVLIGTTTDDGTNLLQVNGAASAQKFRISTTIAQPANSGDWGIFGNSTAGALDCVASQWRWVVANGSSYPAPVATLSPAGALAIAAGLTATTGSFSGAIQLTQTTGTTSPSAGGAGALPATPAGYMTISINGTNRQVAYY